VGFGVAKIMSWQAKQKGKMVLNAGLLLKKRQVRRCERAEKVAFYLLFDQ